MRKAENGNGSIYKLSGRRKKPWTVQVTSGFELSADQTKSIQKRVYLGYYETRAEAQESLANYLKQPEVFKNGIQTFEQVYTKWYEERTKNVKENTLKGYVTGFNACKPLYKLPFRKISFDTLQAQLNTLSSPSTQKQVKNLFAMLYDYAILHDITDSAVKEKIPYLKTQKRILNDRQRFSNEEISILWDNLDTDFVDITLMLIYSGLRIDIEFLALTKADIDLESRCITIRESKTKSGIRKVPIAKKTLPLWEKYYNKAETPESLLFDITYGFCKRTMNDITLKLLNNRHVCHETRHTTASLLADNLVDSRIVKTIMGHSTKDDVTLGTYTHFDFQVLINAIDTI